MYEKNSSLEQKLENYKTNNKKNKPEIFKEFIRYGLTGYLPGHIQEKIAKKRGENPKDYTESSIALEALAVGSVAVGDLFFGPGMQLAFGCILLMFPYFLPQFFIRARSQKPIGNPLVTLPYYSVALPYRLGKYTAKKIGGKRK